MRRVKSAVPIIIVSFFCLAADLAAQPLAVLPPTDAAAQEEMLAHVKAYATKYALNLPDFTCAQSTVNNSDELLGRLNPRSIVVVDFIANQRDVQRGMAANIDLAGLFRDLFSGDRNITFRRWAALRGQKSAVFSLASQDRQAEIYAAASTGTPARIVFRGFDTPAHFARYSCSAQLN